MVNAWESKLPWHKEAGSMLEPAYLYADYGEEPENPLELLAKTVERYYCRAAVVHLGDMQKLSQCGCKNIITVVDFPYGRDGLWAKQTAIKRALVLKAWGADMVIDLWKLQRGDWSAFKNELSAVRKAIQGKELKAICQMPFLWQYEHRAVIFHLVHTLADCGVDFIKDWTTINNFSKPINVALETRAAYTRYLRELIDDYELPLQIKIAGGVNENNVFVFKEAGADVFGVGVQKVPKVHAALVDYLMKKDNG